MSPGRLPSLPGAPLCCGQTGGSDQLRPPLPREPSVPALPTPPPPGTPKSNAGIDSSLGDAGSRSHARVASGVARRTGCWSLVCRSNLCLYCVSRNYQLCRAWLIPCKDAVTKPCLLGGACTTGDRAPRICPGAAVGSEPGTRPSSLAPLGLSPSAGPRWGPWAAVWAAVGRRR